MAPEHVDIVVLATTCLHNFLNDDKSLWQPGEFDNEEIPRGLRDLCGVGGNAGRDAFEIRDRFKNYFISPEGQVPWQEEMVNRGRLH